jgi:hypothetical protein
MNQPILVQVKPHRQLVVRLRARRGRHLRWRLSLVCAVAATIVVASGCGRTSRPPAPKNAALALVPGLRIVRSVAGLSAIDSGSGRHYRYTIVAGPHRARPAALLRSEVQLLEKHGWRLERPITIVDNGNHTTTVGLTHHRAVVLLDGPHDLYVALQYLNGVHDLNQAYELDPGGPVAPPRGDIRKGVPMLSATLGHQND